MKQKHVLVAVAVAALLLAALLIGFRPHWAQRDVTLSTMPLPPCSGLQGLALDLCQVQKQVRPQDYETGPAARGLDASSNTIRAARGSGIEGVSSANTTTAPPSAQ